MIGHQQCEERKYPRYFNGKSYEKLFQEFVTICQNWTDKFQHEDCLKNDDIASIWKISFTKTPLIFSSKQAKLWKKDFFCEKSEEKMRAIINEKKAMKPHYTDELKYINQNKTKISNVRKGKENKSLKHLSALKESARIFLR